MAIHTPVMGEQTIAYLAPDRNESFIIDGTLGEGGHSELFLQRFPKCHLTGIDVDSDIQAKAQERLASFGKRVSFVNGWFNDYFKNYTGKSPDRILLDLGISLYHYNSSGRGFTYSCKEPLDMRLDPSSGKSAAYYVNTLPEKALADLLFQYGEEWNARRIASRIVRFRKEKRIEESDELSELVFKTVGGSRGRRIHPATKTFQALRIVVNNELGRLEEALEEGFRILCSSGKMGIISFHSLEDRIVKHTFRRWQEAGVAHVVTKKPVIATDEEVRNNPPSRSAKLRVLQKV